MAHPANVFSIEAASAEQARTQNTGIKTGRVLWESSFGIGLTHTPLQAHLTEQQRKHCLQRNPGGREDLQKQYYSQALKSTHLTQKMDSADFIAHIKQSKAQYPHPGDPDFTMEHIEQPKMPCCGPTAAELVEQCPWAREETWEVPRAWDNGVNRGRAPGNRKELTMPIGYSPRTSQSEHRKGVERMKGLRNVNARSHSARTTSQKLLMSQTQKPSMAEPPKEATPAKPPSKPPSVPRTMTDFRSRTSSEAFSVGKNVIPVEHHALPPVQRRTTPRRMWRYDDREALFVESVLGRSHFDVLNNVKPPLQRNGRMTPRGKNSRGVGLELNPCPGMHESRPHPHHHLQTAPVSTTVLCDIPEC